jgi:hypothetical protein
VAWSRMTRQPLREPDIVSGRTSSVHRMRDLERLGRAIRLGFAGCAFPCRRVVPILE